MSISLDRTLNVPENIVKPGVIGRSLRFLTGVIQLQFVSSVLPQASFFWSNNFPQHPGYWVAFVIAFIALTPVVNIGFNVRWGRKLQYIFLTLALAAVMVNFSQYGAFWGASLNFLIFLLSVYVHGHLGLAHVLSGIMGTPGCEMRVIPQLIAILMQKKTEACVCPGWWDKLDHWEVRRRTKKSIE